MSEPKLVSPIDTLIADNARLREAIEQALDDMGEQGLSVCQQAKEMLAAALKDTKP